MATTTKGKLDELVDRAADRLEELAEDAAAGNGLGARFADELAEDAVFLRKLKPTLIVSRWRGEATVDDQPERETFDRTPQPARPANPQPERKAKQKPKSKPKSKGGGGLNPFLVIGAALAVGMLAAHVIDWRSHAHPRD